MPQTTRRSNSSCADAVDTGEESLRLMPFYHDRRNAIVRPNRVIVITRYFWTEWKPVLGPNATMLVIEFRSRCYKNDRTGEIRDACSVRIETIAKSIGIGRTTVKKLLKDPNVKLFIQTIPQWKYDPRLQKQVQAANVYRVAMDDPLTPADVMLLSKDLSDSNNDINELHENSSPEVTSRPLVPAPEVASRPLVPRPEAISRPLAPGLEVVPRPHICEVASRPPNNITSRILLNDNVPNAKSRFRLNGEVVEMVERLEKKLGETRNRGWFVKVCKAFYGKHGSCEVVNSALQDALDLATAGRIRKSAGAAFTDQVKRYAGEYGVDLS